jgi:hypothetical protein
MAVFNSGSGATINVTSWEKYLAALLWLYQFIEGDVVKNPQGINYLTSSASDDGIKAINANFTCPCLVTTDSSGEVKISGSTSFVGVTFSVGTGGDAKADNLIGAIIEATIKVRAFELTTSRNPGALNYLSWNVTALGDEPPGLTGTFSSTYSMPTEFSVNAQGQQIRQAVDYLI